MKRKRDPEGVGDILRKLRNSTDLGKNMELAQVWEQWDRLAGGLATHGRPYRVKEGTLYLEAESTVWMHKFAYLKWELIGRINRMAGKELVSDIFIQLVDSAGDE